MAVYSGWCIYHSKNSTAGTIAGILAGGLMNLGVYLGMPYSGFFPGFIIGVSLILPKGPVWSLISGLIGGGVTLLASELEWNIVGIMAFGLVIGFFIFATERVTNWALALCVVAAALFQIGFILYGGDYELAIWLGKGKTFLSYSFGIVIGAYSAYYAKRDF